MTAVNINAYYGNQHVVKDANIKMAAASITAIVGINGSGKTTLMRTLIGIHKNSTLSLTLNEKLIRKVNPILLFHHGLVLCPEGREIFSSLSVEENLMAGLVKSRLQNVEVKNRFDESYTLFPKLKQRATQQAGTLSGGEQQMLALARAFICKPSYILLDEPFLGLAPVVIGELIEAIASIASDGASILMAEQHLSSIKKLTQNILTMESGTVTQ